MTILLRSVQVTCIGLFTVFLSNAQLPTGISPFKYSSVKDKTCSKAAVVSAHPLASAVGLSVLKKGGNAFDAAIATQWALAVVYPVAGNLGGGGFLVATTPSGKTLAIDYREMAPSAATENMYIDPKTGKANTRRSQHGHLAAGVPGTPAGLFASHKYAKLPMSTLLAPAIALAQKGYAITQAEANNLNQYKADFERLNTELPVFVRRDRPWRAGDTLLQPQLAKTLIRISKQGQKGFYEGPTAQLIVNEMARGGGIISLADLKNYVAKARQAISFNYKGYRVVGMPPPSSGGILLQQMLGMLQGTPLPHYGYGSLKAVQLMTEVERLAYADRAEHLGDPDYYKVPAAQMVSAAYLAKRMLLYDSTKAGISANVGAGEVSESPQTTHLSVLDQAGNAVSVTTTLNGNYGCKTVVGGAGFLLNNEMDDFSIQPGVPNMFGAVGGTANAIAPGKRMLSSMTPTIVLKNNKPFMVVGTPGGTTIITSVLQTIVNVIDFGLSAHDAVNLPKFHHQWLPDDILVEASFPAQLRTQLVGMGYKLRETSAIGRTELILVLPNGKLDAVADHRGDDAVAGY